MKIESVLKQLKKYGIEEGKVDVAIILGSGQAEAMPELKDRVEVSYSSLGMPASKVKGHKGSFVYGKLHDKGVLFATRYHFYEEGDLDIVRLPYRIFSNLGIKLVMLFTATGGVREDLNPGDLMIINDHINLSGTNPLVGMQEGIEFIDMSDAYSSRLIDLVKKISKKHKLDLTEGVHMQFSGPSYETPAEVTFARKVGASCVSMSTAMDTLICRYFNMEVLAIAMISNKACDKNQVAITHEDVLKTAKLANDKIKIIINEVTMLNKI